MCLHIVSADEGTFYNLVYLIAARKLPREPGSSGPPTLEVTMYPGDVSRLNGKPAERVLDRLREIAPSPRAEEAQGAGRHGTAESVPIDPSSEDLVRRGQHEEG